MPHPHHSSSLISLYSVSVSTAATLIKISSSLSWTTAVVLWLIYSDCHTLPKWFLKNKEYHVTHLFTLNCLSTVSTEPSPWTACFGFCLPGLLHWQKTLLSSLPFFPPCASCASFLLPWCFVLFLIQTLSDSLPHFISSFRSQHSVVSSEKLSLFPQRQVSDCRRSCLFFIVYYTCIISHLILW